METTKQVNIDTWESFVTHNWFRAALMTQPEDMAVCIGLRGATRIMETTQQEKKYIILKLEYKGLQYELELNRTNRDKVEAACPTKPTDIIGKKIWLRKVLVTNPTTKKEVESVRITKVE